MNKLSQISALKITLLAMALGLAGNAALADTRYWTVSFDVQDGNPPEHVVLNFTSSDAMQPNPANTFSGYLIDAASLTGTHGGNAVQGLAPNAFFNANDNLFNPRSGMPFDAGGLAYRIIGSDQQFQIFHDGKLQACSMTCYAPLAASPFEVSNFNYSQSRPVLIAP